MAGAFNHIGTTCCNAGCADNYLPRWWKIDVTQVGLTGPMFPFTLEVLQPEYVEGPSTDGYAACHWQQIIGFETEVHVYKQFINLEQQAWELRVRFENQGDWLQLKKGGFSGHNCLDRNLGSTQSNDPPDNYGWSGDLALRPWTYADD